MHLTGTMTHPLVGPTDEPCLSDAVDDQHEASRSNYVRHTRSQTTIFTGNTPLRPDYHAAARSGFAASAPPASPPKALFRSSPPPRSVRLGSTIPLGRPPSPRLTPAPNPQLGHSPPAAPPVLQFTAPNIDTSAVAEHLLNTLLSHSHRDSDQVQRADPLCDTTPRYIQLGCPNRPPLSLCDHLPSHTRPETADIVGLAAKGRLLLGGDGTVLLVRNPITVASAPDDHYSRRGRPPFNDPVRIYLHAAFG